MIETLGIVASVVIPFFNIPLILRIRRRGSSGDISMVWTAGVWVCSLLMLPEGLASPHLPFKLFAIVNLALFSVVVWHVLKYRRRCPEAPSV